MLSKFSLELTEAMPILVLGLIVGTIADGDRARSQWLTSRRRSAAPGLQRLRVGSGHANHLVDGGHALQNLLKPRHPKRRYAFADHFVF